jgi:hypothetical protein
MHRENALAVHANCAGVALFQKRHGVRLAIEHDHLALQIGDENAMQKGAPFTIAEPDDLMARTFDFVIHGSIGAGSAAALQLLH